VWTQNDVLKLLHTIDRGNPCGKRDYAIFLLIAMLGMRVGDFRLLKLDNLKWNMNTIEFVQSKTAQPITLPLLKDVGWAIIDYLKNGRPNTESPFIFLRHLPPFDRVHDRNYFYHIVRRCIRLSRVIPPGTRNLGMHSLRHALATTLLSQSTPLSTIAGILGHTSVESTSVYLRTDFNSLRDCTLEEPEMAQ
jgi:integrase/recombinase XerD